MSSGDIPYMTKVSNETTSIHINLLWLRMTITKFGGKLKYDFHGHYGNTQLKLHDRECEDTAVISCYHRG